MIIQYHTPLSSKIHKNRRLSHFSYLQLCSPALRSWAENQKLMECTIAGIPNFCPKTKRHFCLINYWKIIKVSTKYFWFYHLINEWFLLAYWTIFNMFRLKKRREVFIDKYSWSGLGQLTLSSGSVLKISDSCCQKQCLSYRTHRHHLTVANRN